MQEILWASPFYETSGLRNKLFSSFPGILEKAILWSSSSEALGTNTKYLSRLDDGQAVHKNEDSIYIQNDSHIAKYTAG